MTTEIVTEIHGREVGLDVERALIVLSGVIRTRDGTPVSFPDGIDGVTSGGGGGSEADPVFVEVTNANANGSATSANSAPTVMAYDQNVAAFGIGSGEYVAPEQSDQALGPTGATGDFLSHVTIVPHNTSPGAVAIKDGSGTARNIFEGGSNSVSNLAPFTVALGWTSTSGAWKLTTGADVHAFGIGRFT